MKYLTLIFFLSAFHTFAQNEILLENPSFEGTPGKTVAPTSWNDCSNSDFGGPDILPIGTDNYAGRAKDGNTFLGLIITDEGVTERVGQKLNQKLEQGKCYAFEISLARKLIYLESSDEKKNYVTPGKLKIWGGNEICEKTELLAETSLVINSRWLKFDFTFQPSQDIQFIAFEAHHKEPVLYPYNGNLLLDKASAIVEIDCLTEQKE